MSQVFWIFLILLIGGLWLECLRAREMALQSCVSACRAQGVQLLDDTVALERLGLVWGSSGLGVHRVYRFEFSSNGNERCLGRIAMRGYRVESIRIKAPEASADSI